MRQVKPLLILTCFLLAFVFSSCSHVPSAPFQDSEDLRTVTILGTNDIEGAVRPREARVGDANIEHGGLEWLQAYIQTITEIAGSKEKVLLLDAGDIYQGSLESNVSQGGVMIRAFNHMGYAAAAVGNHEFDFGPTYVGGNSLGVVRSRIREAEFPFLGANIVERKTNLRPKWQNLFSWKVIQRNGISIGLVGLSTPATSVTTNPDFIRSLEFKAMRPYLLHALAELRRQKTAANVLVIHEGGMLPGEPLYELLKNLPQGSLHAVVSGHWHSRSAVELHGIPVVQSGEKAENLGVIELYFERDSKKYVGHSKPRLIAVCEKYFKAVDDCSFKNLAKPNGQDQKVPLESLLPLRTPQVAGRDVVKKDTDLTELLASSLNKAQKYRRQKIALVSEPLTRSFTSDSEVGEIFLQALKERFPKADVILLNGGGIRKDIKSGVFTYGDLFEVYPFSNSVALVQMTGAELRNVLRIMTSGASPWPPVILGAQVSYHKDDKTDVIPDWNGDGKGEVWEKNRLAQVTREDGSPISDEEMLTVATIDFLVNGGDHLGHVFSQINESRIRVLRGVDPREITHLWLRQNRRALNSKRFPILTPGKRRVFAIP